MEAEHRPKKCGRDDQYRSLRVIEAAGDLRVSVFACTDKLVVPQFDLLADLELPEKQHELLFQAVLIRVRARNKDQLIVVTVPRDPQIAKSYRKNTS